MKTLFERLNKEGKTKFKEWKKKYPATAQAAENDLKKINNTYELTLLTVGSMVNAEIINGFNWADIDKIFQDINPAK